MRWVAFGTSPGNGDQLTAVPEEVRIEFSADDSPRSGTGSITGPTGQPFRQGEARRDNLGDPDGQGDSPC